VLVTETSRVSRLALEELEHVDVFTAARDAQRSSSLDVSVFPVEARRLEGERGNADAVAAAAAGFLFRRRQELSAPADQLGLPRAADRRVHAVGHGVEELGRAGP